MHGNFLSNKITFFISVGQCFLSIAPEYIKHLLFLDVCSGYKTQTLIRNELTHLFPVHPSLPPENRKPYDFFMFSWGKDVLGTNGLKNIALTVLEKSKGHLL